jgi:beta-galactosidase GanA
MKPTIAACCFLWLSLLTASSSAGQTSRAPHLAPQGATRQLIVDGGPFLIRGGELGNSTGEPDYLRPFWPKLKALNLNTVLVPVYWDVVEPQEGRFDFASVDGLLRDARANGMRLVLLWFGSWKNSMSCYAPAWVKTDTKRFPRVVDATGKPQEILSPFSAVNRDTDARAFAALMKHLRETDSPQHTVVMVQVENEIGMIPDARDHSAEGDRLFAGAAPAELVSHMVKNREALAPELRALWQQAGATPAGTWREVFGTGAAAEEVFMAWHFARYTQAVAAAGKAELALPMFANAALIRPGYQPGQYPSAGPLPHLVDVWRVAAPALDFIAPDIYFPSFVEWTRRYAGANRPLFIPEALRSPDAAANALFAIGQYDAIGFCPFAIESIAEPASSLLAASYAVIAQLTPLIVQHQGHGTMAGLLLEHPDNRQPQQVRLGGWVLNATFERASPPSLADGVIVPVGSGPGGAPTLPAGGLVIAIGPDEFIFAGLGVTVTFATLEPGVQAGILSVAEGRFAEGQWQHVRWLNGDQTHQGRHVRLEPGRVAIQRVKLYEY